jgi:hypothetical protein
LHNNDVVLFFADEVKKMTVTKDEIPLGGASLHNNDGVLFFAGVKKMTVTKDEIAL